MLYLSQRLCLTYPFRIPLYSFFRNYGLCHFQHWQSNVEPHSTALYAQVITLYYTAVLVFLISPAIWWSVLSNTLFCKIYVDLTIAEVHLVTPLPSRWQNYEYEAAKRYAVYKSRF